MNRSFDHTSFPFNLRRRREFRDMTQRELAAKANLQEAAVSHFECARRYPNLENLVALCHALNCTPNDLLAP